MIFANMTSKSRETRYCSSRSEGTYRKKGKSKLETGQKGAFRKYSGTNGGSGQDEKKIAEDSKQRKREIECFKCKGNHFIRDCDKATDEKQKKYVGDYRSSRTGRVQKYQDLCWEDDLDQDMKEDIDEKCFRNSD